MFDALENDCASCKGSFWKFVVSRPPARSFFADQKTWFLKNGWAIYWFLEARKASIVNFTLFLSFDFWIMRPPARKFGGHCQDVKQEFKTAFPKVHVAPSLIAVKSRFSRYWKFPKMISRVQETTTPSEIDLQIIGLCRDQANWKYPQRNELQARATLRATFECTQKCGAPRRRDQKSKNQLIIRCHPCTRGARETRSRKIN